MATTPDASTAAPALFHVQLRPHCSLSPRGFRILMAAVTVAFSVVGIVFFIAGAWPVIGFCGLEVLLIWACFKINFRSLDRYETILLTDDELELRRVAPDGAVDRVALQPNWLKVVLEEEPSGANRLLLRSHGREVAVGAFLSPDERIDLARALESALRRQRSPAI